MIRHISPIALVILTGCSNSVSGMSCSDVADEAARISKGALVAINSRRETSRNDQRLVCHGVGLTNLGAEMPMRFQAFKGDDGGILIKYDTDEYQADQLRTFDREQKKELDEIMNSRPTTSGSF